jgi:hypothetical protein
VPGVGIVTSAQPPTAVVNIQGGMAVQPVVLVDQNGNYVTPGGSQTTAGSLATTTVPVNVAAATAPTSGQVLTASSGTTATWKTPLPLTTAGDMLIENATPAPARLAVGSAGQVLGVSGGLPAWGMGLTLLATTGASGTALVNGTPTILTWTPPNDGALHRVVAAGGLVVTSTETGGQINLNFTDPAGNVRAKTLVAAAQGAGYQSFAFAFVTVEANTTVTITQTALTGGAAVLYAELWGS